MENIDKKYIWIVSIVIIAIIIIIIYAINNTKENSEEIYESLEIVEDSEHKEEKEKIKVHIAGAVVTEGLVELEEGARVEDAIKGAGGTTINANMKDVNLAQKLQDGQKIYIPKQDEEEKYKIENNNENISNVGKININTATQTELELLTGIGPSMAGKIISYRNKNGNFKSIDEIKEVSGIGEAKFEMIKEEITI